MALIDTIRKKYRQQTFIPKWYSIFINSNYIIAKGISSGVRQNAQYMSGLMLDFGCGTKPYSSLFKVKQHIGVDIKNTAHQNNLSDIDKFYDGKTIPYPNEYFNSIFCSEVLTHIFNTEEILSELCRVLKTNGHFLLTVPFVWKENEKPHDNIRYTSFGIKHLLEKNGFEVIVQEKKGSYFLTIAQLLNDYIYTSIPNIKILKLLITLCIISLLQSIEIVLAFILPSNKDIFINNVIVARKK